MLSYIVAPNGDILNIGWGARNVDYRQHDCIPAKFGYNRSPFTTNVDTASINSFILTDTKYQGMKHLVNISSSNTHIEFKYQNDTDKLPRDILTDISISIGNDDNRIKKTITLKYLDSLPFMLTEVRHSTDGIYRFQYNLDDRIPFTAELPSDGIITGQDYWGFYNGKMNKSLFPSVRLNRPFGRKELNAVFNGGNREIDTIAMQTRILTQATYPTGATVNWKYETHEFSPVRYDLRNWSDYPEISNPYSPDINHSLSRGGGLRVKTMTIHDGKSKQIFNYKYGKLGDGKGVCKAAPVLHTFITEKTHVGLLYQPQFIVGGVVLAQDYQFVAETDIYEIASQSHYLTSRDGEIPIWYEEVTEITNEGKKTSYFSSICPDNTVGTYRYIVYPDDNYTIFSGGPRLICQEIYSGNSGKYIKVQTDSIYYTTKEVDLINDLRINRRYYQTQLKNAPDFCDCDRLYFSCLPYSAGNVLFHDTTIVDKDAKYRIDMRSNEIYHGHDYNIHMMSERLTHKSTTLHTATGDFTTWEKYSYIDGTSLINSIEYSTSDGKIHRQDVDYTPQDKSIASAMQDINMVGVPIRTINTYGHAVSSNIYNMTKGYENLFLPKSVSVTTRNKTFIPATYQYDEYGNLIEVKRSDNTVTSYIWGYYGACPVYRIDGLPIKELEDILGYSSVNKYNDIQTGNGDDITMPNLEGKALVTSINWIPDIGPTLIKEPTGLSNGFEYDSEGRPYRNTLNGNTLSTTAYNIGVGGRTWFDSRKWLDINGTNKIITIEYFDAMARNSSTITSTGDKYLASMIDYDDMGRPIHEWNTTPVNSHTCSENEICSSAKEFYEDNNPFTTITYEPSSRNLPVSTIRQGEEWIVHPATTIKIANKNYRSDKVPRFEVTSDGIEYKGAYSAGTLLGEETIDEDGIKMVTYTDMRGLKILERRGETGSWLDTRYIYDDYGALRYVLPPAMTNATYTRSNQQMKDYAYWYDYDHHGNITLKKLPGCEAITYCYDPAGRLVTEQDGNTKPKRLIHLYDNYGREVITGLADWDEETFKTFLSKPRTFHSTRISFNDGYICEDFDLPSYNLLISRHYNDKGQITKESAGETIREYEYDSFGRISKEQTSRNTSNAVVTKTFTYTYTGNTATVKTEYAGTTVPIPTLYTRYSYDDFDRLTATRISRTDMSLKSITLQDANDTTAVMISEYDNAGRIVSSNIGQDVKRSFTYDVHGWLVSQKTIIDQFKLSSPLSNEESIPFRSDVNGITPHNNLGSRDLSIDIPGIIEQPGHIVISETLKYADGTKSRYNGFIGSRIFNEGRYDYNYDSHGRLTSAHFINQDTPEANYSSSYSYDPNSNVTSLFRHGVTDVVGTTAQFSTLDEIYYFRQGNQLTALGSGAMGTPYEGRTGLQRSGSWDISYDPNGNINADGTRDITSINYNHLNQPTKIDFVNGSSIYNYYDSNGIKFLTTFYDGQTSKRIDYIDNVIKIDGEVTMVCFPGGYFDGNGKVHYYLSDFQGNITHTLRANGGIEQRGIYYPDGEPWREPSGDNPFLFAGKERITLGGINMSDFGPRLYHSAIATWLQPDPLCEERYDISPYVFCNSNPVRYSDPSGMYTIVNDFFQVISGCLDEDLNIYLNDKSGRIVGKTLSPTSFYDSDTDTWRGTLNPTDYTGQEFLNMIENQEISVIEYASKAITNGQFDFKNNPQYQFNTNSDIYRGMRIRDPQTNEIVYTSARDIGNIVAGYICGLNNISWFWTRIAFDGYNFYEHFQYPEGISSRNAQWFGYQWGVRTANKRKLSPHNKPFDKF